MPKRVTFNPRVQVRQGSNDTSVDLNEPKDIVALPVESNAIVTLPVESNAIVTFTYVMAIIGLAMIATWIAGLVKMGMCGGVSSGYFWATPLLFIFIPGPGSLAGFIMAIIALATLRPGKTALGMTCPPKN